VKVLSLIGIDNDILSLCSKQEQRLYRFFNILQLFLILIVGFSSYYIIDIIFENTLASIFLGLFWAFIFFNLYRFILYTVTGKKGKSVKEKLGLFFPNIFKISVIVFFAIFISFPIELFLHSNFIEANLPNVLSEKIQTVKLEIDKIYLTKENEIKSRIFYYQNQLDELERQINEQKERLNKKEYEITSYQIRRNISNLKAELNTKKQKFIPIIKEKKNLIANLDKEKKEELSQYKRIIKHSNLLIERFALLFDKKPFTEFFLTMFIIILFLSPLLYKLLSLYYPSFKYEKFHNEKMKQEILYNYEDFKQLYKQITYYICGDEKEYLELYVDAPFNTIKKIDERKKEKKGEFSSFLIANHKK